AEIANTPDDVDTLTAVTSSGIRCSDDSVTHKRRTLSSTMHWNVGSFGTMGIVIAPLTWNMYSLNIFVRSRLKEERKRRRDVLSGGRSSWLARRRTIAQFLDGVPDGERMERPEMSERRVWYTYGYMPRTKWPTPANLLAAAAAAAVAAATAAATTTTHNKRGSGTSRDVGGTATDRRETP
ncbi:hypothetical protein V1477_017684, partial [Vespula maculifrons]